MLADATLPDLRTWFPKPFSLSLYHDQLELERLLPLHEVLLCRSTLSVNAQLLADSNIRIVATASSGIDHIDEDYLTSHNIQLVDAKGSNANAVADYVVSTLASCPPKGRSAGVIGIGEVGRRVVKRLHAAGFQVICFDPFKMQQDANHQYCTLKELTECDVICIHANLHNTEPYPSKNLLNAEFFKQLQPGTMIINAARGGIVNETDLLNAPIDLVYCTDVYCNEPNINPAIIDFATLCTPHIAGHSIEAKQAAIIQISQKLHQYYHLTPPPSLSQPPIDCFFPNEASWQQRVQMIYNPNTETAALKSSKNKVQAFLSLRKAHTYRHDFSKYCVSELGSNCFELLLGHS